jgi:hypothetical protein
MRLACAALPLLSSIGFLAAQTPFSGPMVGFTFDRPTGSLRGISGLLGSALLGAPVLLKLDYASVAPLKDYAIAFQGGQCLFASNLRLAPISIATLPGQFSVPDGIAWSGDGSVAVLYSPKGNWVQTISGLPLSPNAGPLLDVSPLGGTLSNVAVDFHGEQLVIGVLGDSGGVFRIADSQTFLPLLTVSKPISLSFSDEGGKLYILDGASKQVFELNMGDSTSQSWPIADLEDPIAVRVIQDTAQVRVVYVAGGSDSALVSYDSSSHEVIASIPLTFQPTEMESLGRNSFVLRPRTSNDDPLWTFRTSEQPTVYFVPASPLALGEDSGR